MTPILVYISGIVSGIFIGFLLSILFGAAVMLKKRRNRNHED